MAEATIPQVEPEAKASRYSTRQDTCQGHGLALAREREEQIEHVGRGVFEVPGCSGGSYTVNLAIFGGEPFCTCPDRPPEGEFCKHIYAATAVRAKRQAEGRRKQAAKDQERGAFSPALVAANLERMGA